MSGLPGTRGRRRVYLLRHGAVDYFDADGQPVPSQDAVSLSAQGHADARAAGEALAHIPFDRVYVSPLGRTRDTAEIVLNGRALPITEIATLREIKTGRPQLDSIEAFERAIAYTFEDAHRDGARFVGGEPFRDAWDRVIPTFEALLLDGEWTTALVAAHGGVNCLILCWACGVGLAGMGRFEQDPGCINVLDFDIADGAIVRRLIRTVNFTPGNPSKHEVFLTDMERMFVPVRRMLEGGG